MARYDPYNHERSYKRWQKKGMPYPTLPKKLASTVSAFIMDMEVGANVNPSSKRGSRSYCRLNNIRNRMDSWGMILEQEIGLESWDDLALKERELLYVVKRMREGLIINKMGKPFRGVGTMVKMLKSFWHWYQRVNRKQGREILDVTVDLDARDPKPKFNYFTIEDLRKLCDASKQDYRVMMMFLFDSGIRAPTEMMNVRVKDLEWDGKTGIYTLNIREESAKTFGRRIKLMLCSEILRAYLTLANLSDDDRIFTKVPSRVNQYLKKRGYQVLGIGAQVGDDPYNIKEGLTLYDFRHAAACYWLPRYKSESALKYRFGWKKSDMIHYYTELLGMKDTIQEEDLYVDISKTELEREINEKGKEIDLLKEQMGEQETKMQEMMKVLKALQYERMLEQ